MPKKISARNLQETRRATKTPEVPKVIIEVIVRTGDTATQPTLSRGLPGNALSLIRMIDYEIEKEVLENVVRARGTRNPPVEIMVKTVILRISGRPGNPEDLGDDEALADLFTSDAQYVMLRAYLEAIARLSNKQAVITLAEVMDCSTVKDCIDLVKSKS
jgi:hypothetical protein